MRSTRNGFFLLSLLALTACAAGSRDVHKGSTPMAGLETRINFLPPTRAEALRNLEIEREVNRKYTAPIRERIAELERGRQARYDVVAKEFPECRRQRHCQSDLSHGSVAKFERYGKLAKEINEYDTRIAELEGALGEWDWRYKIRQRAILNRFLVHEFLDIPRINRHLQGVLVHSLETFDSRKALSMRLVRYAGDSVVPSVVGDLDFRMLGEAVDEGAVLATFDVYLAPGAAPPEAPTRYVVTMLVNTLQLDLRYYDDEFLRIWGERLEEPFQVRLRNEVFCNLYSISSNTLLPKLPFSKEKPCSSLRSEMQTLHADKFEDRFGPEKWMLAVAYFPMALESDLGK
jgi:hypothetical protein